MGTKHSRNNLDYPGHFSAAGKRCHLLRNQRRQHTCPRRIISTNQTTPIPQLHRAPASASYAQGTLMVINTGGRDIVIDKLAVRGQECSWHDLVTNKIVLYCVTTDSVSSDIPYVYDFNLTATDPADNQLTLRLKNLRLHRRNKRPGPKIRLHHDDLHHQPRLNHHQRHRPNLLHHTLHSPSHVLPRIKRPGSQLNTA